MFEVITDVREKKHFECWLDRGKVEETVIEKYQSKTRQGAEWKP